MLHYCFFCKTLVSSPESVYQYIFTMHMHFFCSCKTPQKVSSPLRVANYGGKDGILPTKHLITVSALYIGMPCYVTMLLQDSTKGVESP